MNDEFSIWTPYQVFYIESMLTITSSAVFSVERLSTIFDPTMDTSSITQEEILDWVQNIFTQAAALSRYFWTSKKKEKIHQNRSIFLRAIFKIDEQNPIKNRDLRNTIEHFDENLDIFTEKSVVGTIIPNYVGPKPDGDGVPLHVFRAYYTDIGVFDVLGVSFELEPVVKEIYRIHETLISFSENGSVFRKQPKA